MMYSDVERDIRQAHRLTFVNTTLRPRLKVPPVKSRKVHVFRFAFDVMCDDDCSTREKVADTPSFVVFPTDIATDHAVLINI